MVPRVDQARESLRKGRPDRCGRSTQCSYDPLRLLKRLGFQETHRAKGTWTIGDQVCDSVYLKLPRP